MPLDLDALTKGCSDREGLRTARTEAMRPNVGLLPAAVLPWLPAMPGDSAKALMYLAFAATCRRERGGEEELPDIAKAIGQDENGALDALQPLLDLGLVSIRTVLPGADPSYWLAMPGD